ncbi:MAG: ATP-binding protein [Eubacteriales bacterium]|nr:ATP-binding protein [Eubacteriales bacterium]
MDETQGELIVPAQVAYLDEAQAFIDDKLTAAGFSTKSKIKIAIAVEEIFVNIATYAYAPASGDVRILFSFTPAGAAAITFIDSGVPYDPLTKPDPDVTLQADARGVGGLGIYMVKKSMDDMRYAYLNGQNRLTLIKGTD